MQHSAKSTFTLGDVSQLRTQRKAQPRALSKPAPALAPQPEIAPMERGRPGKDGARGPRGEQGPPGPRYEPSLVEFHEMMLRVLHSWLDPQSNLYLPRVAPELAKIDARTGGVLLGTHTLIESESDSASDESFGELICTCAQRPATCLIHAQNW